ncbi:uncharacterized protein H6S33_003103 [Morchella sextelata]|uniref:uncharacterized protein n=1 Tax=Morchella sextelata TaxID=1174677 RepID=UPI001D03CDA5|nr:uncharacterized protein H6S33_003103 [Morchella sextelata]KAH0607115.1 hypothetical protein H6S33_003103 [Morchella sextelata]
MSSLQDLLNPVSSGPSSPVTTRLPSPPPVHKYGLATNTQEAASALVLFADHHHRNSFSLPNNEHDGDRSPVTPIATHHDSSSSDTVSSSPVPPVSPRRVAPMRNSAVHKSSNDFTQILRASSSERDADGDEEDEEMGEDNVKPQGLTDYRLSPTPMVQEGLRSSPPAASASPPPSTVSQNLKDVVTTSITAKSKKRPSAKNVPAKKKGIAKPQKKKRKVDVEEDDLESEIPVNGQRPASIPPRRETESPPPTKSLPPLPLSPLPKYNAEGMELYCVCRKPDSGKWMIGCDGCEDWFHGECINVAEKDGDLIDKYFCPRCEVSGHGITTWKRKCRLPVCRRPAQVDKRPKPSKYCCDEHGIQFFKLQTAAQLSRPAISSSELAVVANGVSSATEFRRIGYRMPTPPLSDENFRDYPEEIERLVAIAKERESLKNQRHLVEDRGRYLDWTHQRAKRIHEELKADPESRNVGKEICGYDERFALGEVEWAAWRNSEEGKEVFKEERIPGREGVCLKKKCEKHGPWRPLFMEEAQLHERLHQERLVQLRQEEKKIKERQKRRSVRDNREGTVEKLK